MYFCVVCIVCFVTFPVLFVCTCVLNNCHLVTTQLLPKYISYIIFREGKGEWEWLSKACEKLFR